MHTFKVNKTVLLDQFFLGIVLFFIVTSGAHAGGHHWGSTKLTISGTPTTTDVAGQPYSFTPTASGPGHSTLTFTISGKPAWASFDSATGALAGTPTSADIGVFGNIVISAIDGGSTSSLAPFAITVSAPPNSSPTISGTPPTSATIGSTYSFTPTAGDTDGDPLSFAIQNQPAWASFNPASGALYGTADSTDVGTYSNIVISVSDGLTTVALAPFSITVDSPPGSATLTWTAPTTYTDGAPLTSLAGYDIYYGTAPTSLTQVIDVANAGATSYIVGSLTSATWYFAVASYTTSGVHSALSNIVSKSIP